MSRDDAAGGGESRPDNLAYSATLLLVVGGVSLMGACGLLWSRHGSSIVIDNALLAVLAWCF